MVVGERIAARATMLVLLVALITGFSTSNSDAGDQLALEAGRLANPAYGYSFTVPSGWTLDSNSVPGNLSLVLGPSGSRFSVQVKEKASDLETEFKGLKLAAPFLGGKWSRVGERWTKVGKLRAGELESTRTHEDGSTWHEWNLVCLKKSKAFLLWLSVPDGHAQDGRAGLDQILESFQWEKK